MRWIDENTKVSLYVAVVAVGGAAFFIATLASKTDANIKDIESARAVMLAVQADISEIKESMVRVETKVDILTQKKK